MAGSVIDLEAQTPHAGPFVAPWEALDLTPYMARIGSGLDDSENQEPDIGHVLEISRPRPYSIQGVAPAERGQPLNASSEATPKLFAWDKKESSGESTRFERLPPVDPTHWPLHNKLFIAGFLFFPCWWYGAYRPGEDVYAEMHRFRCSAMTISSVAINISLLILEVGFRNA